MFPATAEAPSPREDPLSYPGWWPTVPILVLASGTEVLTGDPMADADVRLRVLAVAPTAPRWAVLAVGSNANPAQLRHKFSAAAVSCVVPLLPVTVDGVRPGFLPLVASYGYVPAAPVFAPGGPASALVVGLFDDDQLVALDRTEPGYRRRVLDPGRHPVSVAGGPILSSVALYVGDSGLLVDPADATPVAPTSQRRLWAWLVEEVPALAVELGATAESMAVNARRDPAARRRAAGLLAAAGMVAPHRPGASCRDEALHRVGD